MTRRLPRANSVGCFLIKDRSQTIAKFHASHLRFSQRPCRFLSLSPETRVRRHRILHQISTHETYLATVRPAACRSTNWTMRSTALVSNRKNGLLWYWHTCQRCQPPCLREYSNKTLITIGWRASARKRLSAELNSRHIGRRKYKRTRHRSASEV